MEVAAFVDGPAEKAGHLGAAACSQGTSVPVPVFEAPVVWNSV